MAGLDARMEEVARLADRFEVASLAVGSVERAPIFEVVRPFGVAEGISVTLAFGVHGMFGAVLRAEVAGTKEVTRWVLHWGSHAEVLAPASLREEVHQELRDALAPYEDEENA